MLQRGLPCLNAHELRWCEKEEREEEGEERKSEVGEKAKKCYVL